MSKIDFPIGVELPLRGGGVAVLYERMPIDGNVDLLFGRARVKGTTTWEACGWYGSGKPYCEGDHMALIPIKRKAWVVWKDGEPYCMAKTEADTFHFQFMSDGKYKIQVVEEP